MHGGPAEADVLMLRVYDLIIYAEKFLTVLL